MIEKIIHLFEKLDQTIGTYPIFIYIIDRDYRLLWANQALRQRLPDLVVSPDSFCYQQFWKFDAPCPDCFQWEQLANRNIQRIVLQRQEEATDGEFFWEFLSLPVFNQNGELEAVVQVGTDVTRDQKIQEELATRNQLYSKIIDTSADAIIVLDREDRIISWNKGAENIFGYTADEILGKPIVELIPRELMELGELYYIKQELENKGFLQRYETQRLHKNGQLIYVDLTATILKDDRGNVIGSSEIIKDITARKELEFELRRTILELSKINELNEILYSTYDQDEILRIILIAITAGEGLRFNRAFLLLIDNEEGLLKGHLAIGPSDAEEANRIWSNLKDHYLPLKDIVHQYRIDVLGSDQKVNEIVQKIRIPLHRRDHILIHALETRKVYQVVNGQLISPNQYQFDVDGTDLFTLMKNDTFVIVPLFSKKESLGLIIADNCITRRDISSEDIESLKLFANQASLAIENARLYRSLEERIQELQQAYQQLEEKQEQLVRAERLAALGEMSARIAHEIRNPLVSIGGFARLIEKKTSPNSQLKKYAKIIREEVTNLENILNNILSVAKPPAPHKKQVDIHNILHQVTQVLSTALEKRSIRLTMQLECFQGEVVGDEKLLHQAFLNILKNAMEALEEVPYPGEIVIQTRCDEGTLIVTISDNGPGIPPEVQDKIFQPFFTTKSTGTGLGLAIVRQIITQHHGTIAFSSQPGQGTTVTITLPISTEPTHESLDRESAVGKNKN